MKNWRINSVFFLFLVLAIVIVAELYIVQIKKGDYYGALARGQQFSFQEDKGKRGDIFLQKDNLSLTQTKIKNIVYLSGEKIIEGLREEENPEQKLEILASILDEEKENVLSLLQEKDVLKKEISDKDLQIIREGNINGLSFDRIFGRFYPEKELASHVIGFVNEEGEGQYGIEGYYNNLLKGNEIVDQKGKSPFGYLTLFLDSKEENVSSEGANLFLTLDNNIQYFAEKLLRQAKENWNIDSGQIIVEDPLTGKILALSHFPTFDSNNYSSQEDFKIFLNRAVQEPFEPGSVFKPITMAAALEENLITPETKYIDRGCVEAGGPPICNFEKRIWGEQTMIDVLEESINTGAVFVEQKLGGTLFLEYLEKFGFFEKTDIDLQGEVFSANETLKNGYPRDFAVASFGQGIQITSIQIVRAFGAIANGGKLMKPYVVEKIIKPEGEELETIPEIQKQAISENTAAKLTSMLISVVENGSARKAQIDGYFIAGKTGTAQVPMQKGGYSEYETIQTSIGYFPAFSPKVLIFIKLDNPKGVKTAEYSAVPLFRELAKYIIDYWEIPPSY